MNEEPTNSPRPKQDATFEGFNLDKRDRGIYDKFRVERTDGRSEPGEKHDGCRYFVLDVDHDPHAPAALLAYAESCRGDGHEALADDLETLVGDRS